MLSSPSIKSLLLKNKVSLSYNTSYTEYSYNDDSVLVGIDIWDSSEKNVHLFSEVINYANDKIVSTVLIDLENAVTYTTTYSYTNDKITSKTTTVS